MPLLQALFNISYDDYSPNFIRTYLNPNDKPYFISYVTIYYFPTVKNPL